MSGLTYFTSLSGVVSVAAQSQALGDSDAGRALADRLANAASSFDVVGNRAVQAVDMYGRPIDGMEQR